MAVLAPLQRRLVGRHAPLADEGLELGGILGDAAQVPLLVTAATALESPDSVPARESLRRLRGAGAGQDLHLEPVAVGAHAAEVHQPERLLLMLPGVSRQSPEILPPVDVAVGEPAVPTSPSPRGLVEVGEVVRVDREGGHRQPRHGTSHQ